MAFSVAVNCPPLSREGIAGLVAEVSGDRVLSLTAVWLQIQPEVEASESDLPTFAACYPLMQREHGFMILAPRLPEVVECVSSLGSSSSLDVVTWDATVDIVGTRGRSLGTADCFLADLSWDVAGLFLKALSSRSRTYRNVHLLQFVINGSAGKPSASSALQLAEEWISAGDGGLDEDTVQEYHTGEEFEEDAPPTPSIAPAGAEVGALQKEIEKLRQELKARSAPDQVVPRLPAGRHGQEQRLFARPQDPSGLPSPDLQKLRMMAGNPPGRLGNAVAKQGQPDLPDQALLETVHAVRMMWTPAR